ncbi:MAG: hypothetical protein UU81_C0001G0018 [Microgenomates group bacterium GW2011_GWC1_41_8]|uniref:Membrane protein 6-pyruvoyl-tetrahydropterin synthase-related domain-containing protein n=1 Tax=Candidatus Roizmanbacteria bacterium GW2011_GWA1_41_13 TaxID=1618474 RepID=A0A0G0Y3S5_9BACT|nr:MAG: hypothetical protein UU41_C0002G0018 [Candidatus Roizmanbacteria bacterium GW2011_GWA1_41_13]KKS24863.1 MAG: hypothetical protein UU81_C0001G0018 [Microgenomates group bacterium GW2011_GWC1_41_8]
MKSFLLNNRWLLLIIILGILPLYPLLHPGMFEGHDAQDHIARIANFYANLQEGIIIPRWAANLNWGYGHPILMFLYPLPSYIASLFHWLGFSLIDATKIVFALGFALGGLTMYLWIKTMWREKAGIVASALYLFAPYRFVDLYVRGAIGENFFFIWPPLVLYCYYQLIKTGLVRYLIGGAFALAAMILSHNALSIMYLPFMFLYCVLLIVFSKRKLLVSIYSFLMTALGFGLSAFFWLPAYIEGKYTLRDIVTAGELFKRFEPFSRLIYSKWSHGGTGNMSVQVGIIQWIMIGVAVFLIYNLILKIKRIKDRKNNRDLKFNSYLLLILFFFFWIALFLITPYSQIIYEKITLFQKFQFPWRWLSLAIFPPAVIGGYFVSQISKRYSNQIVAGIVIAVLTVSFPYWKADGYFEKPESFYTGIYEGTTDTGESAPIWSVRFMLEKPPAYAEVVEGKAEIQTVNHRISSRTYAVTVNSEQARILENTLYFPGWFVSIDGNELPLTDVWWQDPAYRGLITYFVPEGEHLVEIVFRNTKVRNVSEFVSISSLFFLTGLCAMVLLLRKRSFPLSL